MRWRWKQSCSESERRVERLPAMHRGKISLRRLCAQRPARRSRRRRRSTSSVLSVFFRVQALAPDRPDRALAPNTHRSGGDPGLHHTREELPRCLPFEPQNSQNSIEEQSQSLSLTAFVGRLPDLHLSRQQNVGFRRRRVLWRWAQDRAWCARNGSTATCTCVQASLWKKPSRCSHTLGLWRGEPSLSTHMTAAVIPAATSVLRRQALPFVWAEVIENPEEIQAQTGAWDQRRQRRRRCGAQEGGTGATKRLEGRCSRGEGDPVRRWRNEVL